MRSLTRAALSADAAGFLAARSGDIATAEDPPAEAARQWEHRTSNRFFREVDFVAIARADYARLFIRVACLEALTRRPEVLDWAEGL